MDVDNIEEFENLEMHSSDKNYFVTGLDNYSLKKGLEIVENFNEKMAMTKIIFSKYMQKGDDEYLNFLSYYCGVKWNQEKIFFPFEEGDETVMIENQRAAKISYKELSVEYKKGIREIISQIAPEIRDSEIKKMLKNI